MRIIGLLVSCLISFCFSASPGDVCGKPGIDCPALRCACGLCPDGKNQFGCCADCVLDDNLKCQSFSKCPPAPGDVCGKPGVDCPALKCACGTCPDGVNQFGCCADCVLNDKLQCQSISTCPPSAPGDVCGKPGIDCPALKCACGLCPDGINKFGCCEDCVLNGKLKCQSISTCPPRSSGFSDVISVDGWSENNEGSDDGFITIEVSQSVLYGGIGLIIVILIANILCLFYSNCVKSKNGSKKIKYSKVDTIVSSDDDMQHLKRIKV